MKRTLFVVSIALSICIPITANAVPNAPGTACKKIGTSTSSGSIAVECTKVAGKPVWAKVVTKKVTVPDPTLVVEIVTIKLRVVELLRTVASLTQRLADSESQLSTYKTKEAAEKEAAEKEAAEKATRAKCKSGAGPCSLGFQGPGGGIVFYDAGSQQSWGRYLEYAPNGWYATVDIFGNYAIPPDDPSYPWCDVDFVFIKSITDLNIKFKLGTEIGKGKADTDLMLAGCQSGAAVIAHEYHGGGQLDWHLPSLDELNELYSYAKSNGLIGEGGFRGNYYWSASEFEVITGLWGAAARNFLDGDLDGPSKSSSIGVRPVRAF